MASKRAAFNDIATSTTGNFSRSNQVVAKPAQVGFIQKEEAQKENKVQAPLLKPAQRPSSTAAALKGTTGNVTGLAHLTKTTREVVPQKFAANSRKVVTKKNTTIFKDYSTIDQPVPAIEGLQKPLAPSFEDPISKSSIPSLLPEAQQVSSIRPEAQEGEYIAQYSLVELQGGKTRAEVAPIIYGEASALAKTYKPTESIEGIAHDYQGIADELNNDSNSKLDTNDHAIAGGSAVVPLASRITVSSIDVVSSIKDLKAVLPTTGGAINEAKSTLASLPEPEEYWDDYDDEDEDNYEEDGYVTARSFRSRGDNITGNATTTLMPKYNNKIRKELASARDIVEKSKSVEEIEDEAWDTTMVAEYNDEIFEYMRDLEVCHSG